MVSCIEEGKIHLNRLCFSDEVQFYVCGTVKRHNQNVRGVQILMKLLKLNMVYQRCAATKNIKGVVCWDKKHLTVLSYLKNLSDQ
jgi:hypothetical protein